jgi:hypothetical protein
LGNERPLIAGGLHDGHPVITQFLLIQTPEIQQQLKIHVNQSREVFRALNVTGHPKQGVGDAGEHL